MPSFCLCDCPCHVIRTEQEAVLLGYTRCYAERGLRSESEASDEKQPVFSKSKEDIELQSERGEKERVNGI